MSCLEVCEKCGSIDLEEVKYSELEETKIGVENQAVTFFPVLKKGYQCRKCWHIMEVKA